MESTSHHRKGTTTTRTTPEFTMRTRRQEAEEKRKAEVEMERAKEAKKRRTAFEPRENEDVKPQDIIVDPILPKIYIGNVETETEVKVEIVSEDEEAGLGGGDEGNPALWQDADAETEQAQLVERDDQQQNAAEEEKSVQFEEKGVQTEERTAENLNKIVEEHLPLDKVLPSVLPFVSQKDVFRCRLVNKQWRQIVDNFLEDSLVPQHYDNEAFLKKVTKAPSELCPLPKFRIVKYAYQFKSERSLQMFNEHMATHIDSSPFVGGATVTLMNLFDGPSGHLSPATKLFLGKFGGQIRRLVIGQVNLELHKQIERAIGFLKCAKECLGHVPNLERLTFVVDCSQTFLKNMLKYRIVRRMELLMKDLLVDHPAPRLDKLEKLEFKYLKRQENDSTDAYLEGAFQHIMVIPLDKFRSVSFLACDWLYDTVETTVCKVKELYLDESWSWVNYHMLMEMKINAPVEKLTLSGQFRNGNQVDVFKKLCRLRYLSIDKNALTSWNNRIKILSQDDIHTLELRGMEGCACISTAIFIHFPNLRFLIIRASLFKQDIYVDSQPSCYFLRYYGFDTSELELAKLFGRRGTSFDTDIWELLPKLEVLTIQYQNHSNLVSVYSCDLESGENWCDCYLKKGTKDECPFENIVETRQAYQRYKASRDGEEN